MSQHIRWHIWSGQHCAMLDTHVICSNTARSSEARTLPPYRVQRGCAACPSHTAVRAELRLAKVPLFPSLGSGPALHTRAVATTWPLLTASPQSLLLPAANPSPPNPPRGRPPLRFPYSLRCSQRKKSPPPQPRLFPTAAFCQAL